MLSNHEIPHTLLAYFFRSCVAFYNAKPWKVLGEADNVRINVDIEPPIFANILGADKTTAPGVSLISAVSSLEELNADIEDLEHVWKDIAFSGARLSMMFRPEHEAPQWLRDVRRVNKWPLASPSAFPTFLATDTDGTTRELQEDELRALSVAINVISTFVATRRKQIESRVPLGEIVTVRNDAGAPRVALVRFPFDPDAPDGWQLYKIQPGERQNGNAAFEEVWNAALDLPDAATTLDRLTWSFFQDSDPGHIEDEENWDEAIQRFLSWAIFTNRAGASGMTLAERALEQLGSVKSREELGVHRRVVKPHVGIFRVLSVKRNVGMQLQDVLRPETFDVVERIGTRGMRKDNGVLGMLHPISDTQWILSPGVSSYASIPDMQPEESESSDLNFALMIEETAFGANTDWIQEIPAEHLPDVFDSFAEAITETGTDMPTYHELQEQIARAEQPSQVVQSFAMREWWSEGEFKVMMAFVMRVWNVTPREELGRKSPEEMAAGRVRAKLSGSGRRKR